jgi:hypothetical protein
MLLPWRRQSPQGCSAADAVVASTAWQYRDTKVSQVKELIKLIVDSGIPFCRVPAPEYYTANEGPLRIQYKCLVPIYVFPEMKLRGPEL